MSLSVGVSNRSFLTAGVSAAMAGAVALSPVIISQPAKVGVAPVHIVAPQIQLVSVGSDIKALYNAAEPWAAYAATLADYAMSFVPGLWWIAPAIDLAYYSIEPLVQAGVYSFADLIDLDFAQIPIDIQAGVQEAATNFVNYGLAWIGSLVPLPPLPPFPPFPGAAVRTPAAHAVGPRAAAAVAAAATDAPSAAVSAPRSRREVATRAQRAAEPAAAAAATAQKSRRSR